MAGTPSGGAAQFSCPTNFTATSPTSEPTRFSLEALTDPNTELWLIQAPVDFAPDCLNGRLVPLSGSQIVKGKLAGKRHRYRVLRSSGPQAGGAILLAPSVAAGGGLACAPAPQGSLRILERSQEPPSGTLLQPIPTSPPPQIPSDLRPRFCAFGGSLPVTGPGSALALKSPTSKKKKKKRQTPEAPVPQEAVNGLRAPVVDTALGSPERDVAKRKKKQEPQELEAMEPATAESTAETLEPLGALLPSSTTRKRKKKPREADTAGPEQQLPEPGDKTLELELAVRTEPLEETVLSPPRKRKRHKGTEGREPGEKVLDESQLKAEPPEDAVSLPSSKKKKKRKEKGPVEAELGTGKALELPGEMMEPEQLHEAELQAEAALVPAKKRRKKEKCQHVTVEPGAGVVEPELQGDLEPQVALVSPKKEKKERGLRATELRAEGMDPQGEMVELKLLEEGAPEAGTDPASTKKKKKKKRDGESGVPETAPQEGMPEPWQSPESGEVAPTGREKKPKKPRPGPE
ncbi:DNA-directed RNA polymerase I subunit RPA34 [Suricata suricatta]|uniref:DNA-directed RNA polymerase I subunit RPA34 n=1 Tax=Suricata suricatta TaxID=37032 RepID=A0A673V3Z2_SURSU|nr:DNA-directed RNA polymerase I subunit RPA34 [Suricata suricatta]